MKAIFLGCLSNNKYKETCDNAVKIIKMLDDSYQLLDDPPCCGAMSFHIANDNELKEHVNSNYKWFKDKDITNIVTICAGCYNYFTKYYPKFLPNFDIKIQHLTQFIAEPTNLEKLYEGKKLIVIYHDSCHLKNAKTKVIEEPRIILKDIKGDIVFKDMEQNPVLSLCCGAGGGVYSSPIIFSYYIRNC